MKIAYTGLDLPEGKVKFNDPVFTGLARKFEPKKLSPYYFEFLPDAYEAAPAIAITRERILDLLILDMEKIEVRLSRTEDPVEKSVLEKCLTHLEREQPVCDMPMDSAGRAIINTLNVLSFKPVAVFEDAAPGIDEVCRAVLEKAGMMFFYTSGKEEVHAWLVRKGSAAVMCAERIHSDLARGFIKAELVSYDQLLTAHSMQDARAKGLTRLVDRDTVVPEDTVLEIRFKV
jgi:ribosome-binding ATPase YchF (GTP1/OBG family)